MRIWSDVLIYGVAAGQVLFVGIYASRPFWRHPVGRALFVKSFTLMLLVVYIAAGRAWAEVTGRPVPYGEAVGLTIYTLVLVGVWWQLAALVRQVRLDKGALSISMRGEGGGIGAGRSVDE